MKLGWISKLLGRWNSCVANCVFTLCLHFLCFILNTWKKIAASRQFPASNTAREPDSDQIFFFHCLYRPRSQFPRWRTGCNFSATMVKIGCSGSSGIITEILIHDCFTIHNQFFWRSVWKHQNPVDGAARVSQFKHIQSFYSSRICIAPIHRHFWVMGSAEQWWESGRISVE